MNKASGAAEIDESLEVGIGRKYPRIETGAAFRHPENGDDEMSGNNLSTLLGQVTERSMREIENLIHELHSLRKKLETERNRIQSDIVRYSELNDGVMQLTTIITDNMKRLPNPT
jgi:hypothetical protein